MRESNMHGSEEEKTEERLPGLLRLLFIHTDMKDMLLMMLGTVGCIADGSSTPLIMLVLSKIMNNYSNASTATYHTINNGALDLVYVAIMVGMGAFLEGLCWARTSERQTSRLRKNYLQAVLRQDAYSLDIRRNTSTTYQVVSIITTDTHTIQSVLSEKIPNFLMNIATFISSQLVSFYLCWRLSVITIPALLLLVLPGIIYAKLLADLGKKMHKSYAVAGGIAEGAFSSMRTVLSYVAEDKTQRDFSGALETSLKLGIKLGLVKGLAMGSASVAYCVYAFQAWYGGTLVTEQGAQGGDVYTAGVCVVVGGLALGSSLVNFKYFTESSKSVSVIFEMMERVRSIENKRHKGKILENVRGDLEFRDITFAYPSRQKSVVLRKFNLKVAYGQTVGLVGSSGSGKSTIISLLERFYDPLGGEILLDLLNIKELQIKWLRGQIGLVSQEPVLFATSIKENILLGKPNASMEEIIKASKAANAHSFISQLPGSYDTNVGPVGIKISGGQKQRIAIARALLRDPKILLLDEATSALDSESEKAVQDAIYQATIGKTTIIVAHRLSTLRSASFIAVIQSGQVVEIGTHNQLTKNKHSQYSAMWEQQQTATKDEDESLTQTARSIHNSDKSCSETQTGDKPLKILLSRALPDSKVDTSQNHEETSQTLLLWCLMKMVSPQWKNILFGCTASLWFGSIQPFQALCLGELLSVYFQDDASEIRSETKVISLAFITIAISMLISNVIMHYNFGVVGEHLTKRIQEATISKVLTFEIEWFDQDDNTSGPLCSRIATEANMVRSLVCDRLSLLAQVFSATIIAVALSMKLSWQLTFVILSLQPVIIGSFYARGVMMKRMTKKILEAQNSSSKLASEAVSNHKTIAAFSSEEKILRLLDVSLKGPKVESLKQSWYAGLGLFMSQFLTAANTALIVWYGGKLLLEERVTYKHLFQTFLIMVTTGRVIAETGSATSDLSKGIDAVKAIFTILERMSMMDSYSSEGIIPKMLNGNIELRDVYFSYPTRPKQVIFMDLSLKIESNTTVALVGKSGSGKSSILSLIERFYDPLNGLVEIDGLDIKSYNLRALRSHIAFVGQEPTLFAGSIYENIIYGKENTTAAEVIEAATLANAHEFISSMKEGYETYCGERGMQLSGGQKQRISIARAILKNPAILLLDEATSALDSRSESLVQDALEKMMGGRTCVIVAHRLSTIQKVDSIAVIKNGKISEKGSHNELLAKGENGSYYSLIRLQNLMLQKNQEH